MWLYYSRVVALNGEDVIFFYKRVFCVALFVVDNMSTTTVGALRVLVHQYVVAQAGRHLGSF